MSRIGIPQAKQSEIASLLTACLQESVSTEKFDVLARKRAIPGTKLITWEPELCLETKETVFLVHQLIQDQIPAEVKQTRQSGSVNVSKKRRSREVIPVIFCRDTPGMSATKRAELVVEDCVRAKCVLISDSSEGAVLIIPPHCMIPSPCTNAPEKGHVPSWLLVALQSLDAFSDYLRKCIEKFQKVYNKDVRGGTPDYDSEAEILIAFLQCIRKGDPRLYLPLDRFQGLKSWERANANVKSRDHFFHTVNNLLLGFLILGSIFEKVERDQIPETYIQQSGGPAKLLSWEVLWFLTCINHDPAYSAEHFWPNYAYSIGIPGAASSEPVPKEAIERLVAAWDTSYKGARQDLSALYNNIRGKWDPPQMVQHDPAFDRALREAYWDGVKSSHSLISGLMLIIGCVQDRTAKSKYYDPTFALKACDIAALSMMFHDQHCRQVLASNNVQPISFEILPYAALLMFVDSLQDDRRDISIIDFNKHGIVNSIIYDKTANEIVADVCLAELPVRIWPAKITEYESATRWINSASKTHFRIDYKTHLNIQSPKDGSHKKTAKRGSSGQATRISADKRSRLSKRKRH